MHVSSDKDPVEIREGTMYYQLDEYFSYKGTSSMMWIYLLQVCAVRSEVSECVKRPIHIGGSTGPQEKLHKEIEAWRAEEKVCEKPLTIYEQ